MKDSVQFLSVVIVLAIPVSNLRLIAVFQAGPRQPAAVDLVVIYIIDPGVDLSAADLVVIYIIDLGVDLSAADLVVICIIGLGVDQ
jgi:hypothetical protein